MKEPVAVGAKFERLTVTSEPYMRSSEKNSVVLCLCQCGTEKVIRVCHLRAGVVKSCGCARRESSRATGKALAIHNMTHTPEHRIWRGIMKRCYSENDTSYPGYGARGIRVADSWHEFVNFYRDMGPRPSQLHSVDRFPDNRGNYGPGNCRWATPVQQGNNRITCRILAMDGETHTLTEWSRMHGIHVATVRSRLARGIDLKTALSTNRPISARRTA